MPRFSIVVPAYNAEDTLAETLDAVRAQVLDDWECVVVDDGSTDATREIAEDYAGRDSAFRVVSQENQGTGGAYNAGVSAAAGDWVTLCSSDDMLLPEHLTTMASAIEKYPEADIFTCNGYFQWPDGSRTLVYTEPVDANPRSWALEDLFERCFFSVGACYRRAVFDAIGGYGNAYGEDYDFWLRAMASGATHQYIPNALAVHRRSAHQKSADHERAYESDVRSISAVIGSTSLSPRQLRAARYGIELRRSLLAEERATGVSRVLSRLRRTMGTRLAKLRAGR